MYVLVTIVLLCGVAVPARQDKHPEFLGGSLSYELIEDGTNRRRVDVSVISGWVLGTGPCGPNCSRASVGTSTMPERNRIQQQMQNDDYFGQFFIESPAQDHNTNILNNMTEIVLAVNENAKWEQEITRFSFHLAPDITPADINFDGSFWRNLTLQGGSNVKWHIQLTLETNVRNDTDKPNSCPEVQFRPYYRVKLDTSSVIKIGTLDPDFDTVKCTEAQFVQQGYGISPVGVAINEDCTVDVNTSTSLGYTHDTWLSIVMVVKDYNRNLITYGTQKYLPETYSLASTVIQFAVNVLSEVETLTFVPPTPEFGHKFIIFAGAKWNVEIFAKASENTTIHRITTTNTQVRVSAVKHSGYNILVSSAMMAWSPVPADVGPHSVCVTAEDNTGVQSEEMRCFELIVKENNYSRTTADTFSNKPYFFDIPSEEQQIHCPKYATCNVPLYVKSSGAIDTIRIVSAYTDDAKVDNIEQTNDNHQDVFRADLSFIDASMGQKQICFIAIDVNKVQSDKTCIMAHIEPTDPCISSPCRNSGICKGNTDTGTFVCLCTNTENFKFSGDICENVTSVCDSIFCGHGACLNTEYERADNSGIKSHCLCNPGYGGYNCDEVINHCPNENVCSNHGVCENTLGNYSCTCNKRYTGPNCDIEICPSSTNTLECVPDECKNDPCNGNGVCRGDTSGAVCACASGYTGANCSMVKTDLHASVTDIDFVQPTPNNGSTLNCYKKIDHLSSCRVIIFVVSSGPAALTVETSNGLTPTKDSLTQNSNDPKLYHAGIQIQGSFNKDAFICVKVSKSTTTRERCYVIRIKTDPLDDVLSLRHAQRDADVKFAEPSPNDGSEFACNVAEMCKVMIYTTKPSLTCKDVASPNDGVTVFPTKFNSDYNLCETEVSFTFAATGDKTVCVQSATEKFQQSCFTIHVYSDGTDPCLLSPCLNGGHCLRTDVHAYKCKCTVEYTGDRCEKGPCNSDDDDCRSDSFCSIDDGDKTCHCRTGFFGPNCGNASISEIANFHVWFTDAAKPSMLQCVLDLPCSVSLVLSGNPSNPTLLKSDLPEILLGYIDAEIEVNNISVKALSHTYMYQTDITVTGSDVGLFDMCIQAKYLMIMRTKVEEVCFKVDVTPVRPAKHDSSGTCEADVSSLYGYMDRPHFVAPSLPSQSKVICSENVTCHVLYRVTAGDGNSGKCVSVYPTSNSDSLHVHVYSTCEPCTTGTATNSECEVDVSIEPPEAGNEDHLCIGSQLKDSGLVGEERCFNMYTQSTEELEQSRSKSCADLTCQNGAFCDGHIPSCYCKQGFSGSNCYLGTKGTKDPSEKTFVANDMSIPETITCEVETICTVPFEIIVHEQALTSCSVGYSAPQLRALIQDGSPKKGFSKRILQVHPSSVGKYRTCVQLNNIETTADEICITVNVIDSPMEVVEKTKPFYVTPTIPDHSTVLCKRNNTCHVSIYFTNGDEFNNTAECPTVRQVSQSTVRSLHIFDPEPVGSTDCFSDIGYISNDDGSVELCVQLSFPGIKGEKRCFILKTVEDIHSNLVSPCKGVTCYNGGKCIADVDTATSKCICKAGYTGNDCSADLIKTDFLPGVDNIQFIISTSTQRFGIDSALPKTIQCHGFNESCFITIPFYGEKTPFFGYYDPLVKRFGPTTIKYDDNTISVVYLSLEEGTQHRMCFQTTSDGTSSGINMDELCFDVVGNPAGETVNQDKPHFRDSMQNGSVLVCQPSQTCHIYVTTAMMPPNHSCKQVSQCGDGIPGTYVFETIGQLGKCITEVAVTSGTDGSTHDLCLSAGLGGEERHLSIETTVNGPNGFGPCQKLHCINGGDCVSKSASMAKCVCTDDFTGERCHVANPCKGHHCSNNGVCKPDLKPSPQPICFCPAGFDGPTCSEVVDQTSGLNGIANRNSLTTGNQHFMPNSAVPKVVSCEIDIPCCITVPYYGDVNNPPLLGYIGSGLTIAKNEVLETKDAKLHNFMTCVNGTLGQSRRMCLQTTTDGTKQGVNVDEMCFEVELKQGEQNRSVDEPQFINTLPDMTSVSCTINKLCHIQMATTTLGGKCQQIEECGKKTTGLLPQPTELRGDTCLTDVVYKAGGISEPITFCLSAGYAGEERHLVVETKQPTDGYGPCQKLHCLNGGKCMSRDKTGPAQCDCEPEFVGNSCEHTPCVVVTCQNNGKCVADLKSSTPTGKCACSSDYTGVNCETALHLSVDLPGVDNLPPDVPSSNQHFDTNVAIPKTILCFANISCIIPVSYTGDNSLPPILGYYDPSLTIEPITTMNKDTTAGSHGYIASFHLTGEPGTHKVCLQTTTNGTEAGVNIDEICLNVTIQHGDKPDTQQDPHFTQSLPDGSTVTCQPNTVCHIPVVTEKHGGSCQPVERCGHYTIGVQIHKTEEVGDKCISDVAVVTGADDATDDVCLSAGPDGEERHIVVETKDQTSNVYGPCQKLHCLNGGKCVSETSTAVCFCPPKFTGTTCEMQICIETTCLHGQCIDDPHTQTSREICLCDAGYMDDQCTTAVINSTDLHGVTNLPSNTGSTTGSNTDNTPTSNHHFDGNSGIPTEIKCDEINPCCLSVPYHGDVSMPPYTGYHSPGLAIDETTVIPGTNNDDFNTLVKCVKGIPGNHKICLQTSSNGTRQGLNIDELCTDVVIAKGGTTSSPTEPHFSHTVPDMTKITCNHETTCSVPVVTDKHGGVCKPVTTCSGTTIGSRVYDTTDTGSQCLTYIGLKTDSADGTDNLCISAGDGGEERMLVIETKDTNSTGFGPCQKLHCLNGGSCVSRTSIPVCECLPEYAGHVCELTPCASISCLHDGHCVADLKSATHDGVCVCTSGFGGPLCDTSISKDTDKPGVENLPNGVTSVTQHFGASIAVPKEIPCDGVQPCCITIPYQGDSSHPPVAGYKDPALTLDTIISSTLTDAFGTGSHTTSTCVTGVTGKHRICLQTTDDGTENGINIDELCFIIKKDNTGPTAPVSKPHFSNSLPNGTSVECHPNSVCHVVVVTDPDQNDICSNIEKCIGTTLGMGALTTNHVAGKCVTDIGIKTDVSGSKDNLCLSAGPDGEERHFQIETQEPRNEGYGPCQKLHCMNGGKCIAETEVAKCDCASTFVGDTCAVDKDTYLRGTENIPNIPLGNQTFIKNGAIPTKIQCDMLNPCCISIPYHGNNDLPPVLGYFDQDLNVLPTLPAITPDPSSHPDSHVAEVCVKGKPGKTSKLCVQTTSDGTDEGVNIDEVCIQVEIKPDVDVTPLPSSSFNPRLPDGSKFVCKPSITCHVTVVADKHSNTCDQVKQCGNVLSNVEVVATAPIGDKCVTDIKINTGTTENTADLCVTTGTGADGSRNFQVQTKAQEEFGPCQKLHCLNGGKCLSETNTAKCECFEGFTGKTCESNETQSCESTEERNFARKMVVTGYASCSCIVDGKIVDIIKKKPVPKSESIVKAAGFGAGGMVGTVISGIVIYAIVNKLRTPKPELRRQSAGKRKGSVSPSSPPRSKVHPKTQDNLRNMNTF